MLKKRRFCVIAITMPVLSIFMLMLLNIVVRSAKEICHIIYNCQRHNCFLYMLYFHSFFVKYMKYAECLLICELCELRAYVFPVSVLILILA